MQVRFRSLIVRVRRYVGASLLSMLGFAIVALLLPQAEISAQDFLVHGDARLAYWRVSSASPTYLIVVVHGGPGVSHDYLRPEVDQYSKWGEVVYYDQRGCGSSTGHGGWEDHVSDLHRLITAVRGDRKVVLVGSSWGSTLIDLYLGSHGDISGVVLSGRSSGATMPADLRRRLTSCSDANRAAIESMRGSFPGGLARSPVLGLIFEDSGPSGRSDAAAYGVGYRRLALTLPSHDPWFTHGDQYFDAVAIFFETLATVPAGPPAL